MVKSRHIPKIVRLSHLKQIYLILYGLFYLVLLTVLVVQLNFKVPKVITDCESKQTQPVQPFESKSNVIDNETPEREISFYKDILALLHIQKTGGTFWEEQILSTLMIKDDKQWKLACVKRIGFKRKVCFKNQYTKQFFWDRYISKFCDIHADYTELKNCIMYDYGNRIKLLAKGFIQFNGLIHLFTMLRDPVHRYISEYRHVKRGATWEKSVRLCNDELLYVKHFSKSKNWTTATWNEFLSSEYNLANNRQTRMLANYNQLGCGILKCWTNEGACSQDEKLLNEKRLLESAKQTLLSLSFFGLTEYQPLSQYLFQKTFKDKMKFMNNFPDYKANKYETSDEYKSLNQIKQNNNMDIELYAFAKDVFFKRVKYFTDRDNDKITNM